MSKQGELLVALADHVLEQGLGEMSLRPLASSVGSTARMLIYHFNSKEELLKRLLVELRRRQTDVLARWSEPAGADFPALFWSWISTRRMENHARLWIDLHTLRFSAASTGAEVRGLLADWNEVVEKALMAAGWSRQRSRLSATLLLATLRGLLMDLHLTGDRARVNAAAHEFALRWKAGER